MYKTIDVGSSQQTSGRRAQPQGPRRTARVVTACRPGAQMRQLVCAHTTKSTSQRFDPYSLARGRGPTTIMYKVLPQGGYT